LRHSYNKSLKNKTLLEKLKLFKKLLVDLNKITIKQYVTSDLDLKKKSISSSEKLLLKLLKDSITNESIKNNNLLKRKSYKSIKGLLTDSKLRNIIKILTKYKKNRVLTFFKEIENLSTTNKVNLSLKTQKKTINKSPNKLLDKLYSTFLLHKNSSNLDRFSENKINRDDFIETLKENPFLVRILRSKISRSKMHNFSTNTFTSDRFTRLHDRKKTNLKGLKTKKKGLKTV
jgi:hypothetical protein